MKRRSRGVTLVEVLLAAVVCGAGLAVIAGAIATSIRTEVRADGMVRAARLLDLQLGRIEGGILPLQAASGTFEEEGEADVQWDIAVEPATVANLQQVTLTAEWLEGGDSRDLQLVRLIFVDPDATTSALGGQSSASGSSSGSSSSGSSSGSSGSSSTGGR
jgi:hypothetical protein